MSKIISVVGSDGCGKTTFSIKLAQEIYRINNGKSKVIVLLPDMKVPSLGFVFPHRKETELFSIGKALDKTDIFREDILKNTVTVKSMNNFGYLGFKLGENRYSYPQPTKNKILQFISVLKRTADYIITDTASNDKNYISEIALSQADSTVQLIVPDFKCLVYYASNENKICRDINAVKVMNIPANNIYYPKDETANYFNKVQYILPYSFQLNKQTFTGKLSEKLSDSKYLKVLNLIAKEVM